MHTIWGYFNSHPHEEDDVSEKSIFTTFGISTHILTKRMTINKTEFFIIFNISTHILTKRMT